MRAHDRLDHALEGGAIDTVEAVRGEGDIIGLQKQKNAGPGWGPASLKTTKLGRENLAR